MNRATKNMFSAFLIVIVAMLFSESATSHWLIYFGVTYIGLCVGDMLEMKEQEQNGGERE